jgi:hypothetical protein
MMVLGMGSWAFHTQKLCYYFRKSAIVVPPFEEWLVYLEGKLFAAVSGRRFVTAQQLGRRDLLGVTTLLGKLMKSLRMP